MNELTSLIQTIAASITAFGVISLFFTKTKRFTIGDLYKEIKEIKTDIDLIKNNHLAHVYEKLSSFDDKFSNIEKQQSKMEGQLEIIIKLLANKK
jgi:hypothetical protein